MSDTNREYQQRDVLDDIDEAAARITDDHIQDRLKETLRRASFTPGQHPVSDGAEAEAGPSWLLMWA
jgi:hypothetical protein